MKRIVITSLFCFLTIASFAQDAIMKTKPYLQNPTNNGVTVTWLTHPKVHSWVEYGTDPNHLDRRAERLIDGQAYCYNTIHHVRLKQLEPDTKYYYRVASREITHYGAYKKEFGDTAFSEVYSYTPVGENGDAYKAIVLNDLHKSQKTLNSLADQIDLDQINLIFFNGDCIDDPKDEESVLEFMNFAHDRLQAHSIPVIYIRGNHEIRNAYSIQLRDLIDYVGGDTSYGAFTFGDTRFVTLDCGEDKPDSTWVYYGLNSFEEFRNEQTEFLKEELKSKAHKKTARKVLLHHIPVYGFEDKYLPSRELWLPSLKKSKFDIALNAHTHQYQYVAPGEDSNPFPVIIGGGYKLDGATVMLLEKKGRKLEVSVIGATGNLLKKLSL